MAIGVEQALNFALWIGSVDQTMDVEGPAAGIELATSALRAVVNRKAIEELPLNGRSWTDLAILEPGVVLLEAQPSYTAGNSRGNRGFGAQLAISGGRPQQNNYRLDRVSINGYLKGGARRSPGGQTLGVSTPQ